MFQLSQETVVVWSSLYFGTRARTCCEYVYQSVFQLLLDFTFKVKPVLPGDSLYVGTRAIIYDEYMYWICVQFHRAMLKVMQVLWEFSRAMEVLCLSLSLFSHPYCNLWQSIPALSSRENQMQFFPILVFSCDVPAFHLVTTLSVLQLLCLYHFGQCCQ